MNLDNFKIGFGWIEKIFSQIINVLTSYTTGFESKRFLWLLLLCHILENINNLSEAYSGANYFWKYFVLKLFSLKSPEKWS